MFQLGNNYFFSCKKFLTYLESMSISTLTKSPFLILDKLVNLKVWGIIQIWKPFLVTLDIVKEIPLIQIEAFSIRSFFSFLFISKSKRYDLSIFLIFLTLPTVSTCPWQIWPEIFWPYLSGSSRFIGSLILIYLNFDLLMVSF